MAGGRERRKDSRMAMRLPVRAQGFGEDGSTWTEMSTIGDASSGGACFCLKHPVTFGQVLLLSLPIPKNFRQYDLSEPSYRTYALVRNLAPLGDTYRVGVLFLGKNPPRDFEKSPSGLYLLPSDPPPQSRRKERRTLARFEIFVSLRLFRDGYGGGGEELTITENIGKRGARVPTSLPVGKGEVLTLHEVGGDFRTRAEVKNIYLGSDQVPRLNLHFLEKEAPERLAPAQ
ncbi:MAG TPA: PilZ domain-containing protein [Vicinamibacteria bacterium]|nr:PilZ domain-containing protein [Vicinamibacteria bacterium]